MRKNFNQILRNMMEPAFAHRNKSLILKSGITSKLTESECYRIIRRYQNEFWDADDNVTFYTDPPNKCVVVIEFKIDEEGIRLAKLYKRLAQNPSINLKVTFKKLT